jgi:phage terminase small subunit
MRGSQFVNAEQKILFDNLTNLQQRVATNVLAGMTQRQAYLSAGGSAKEDATADVCASEILRNPQVVEFMDSMKAEAVSNAVMSRQEALEKLSNLARTDLKDLVEFGSYELGSDGDGNPIVQAAWRIKDSVLQDPQKMAAISELTAGKDGIKMKTHSPITAIQQLAKMQGWESAGKLEVTGKDGGPIQVRNLDELTDEELAAIAISEAAE